MPVHCGSHQQIKVQAAKDYKCPPEETVLLGEVGDSWFDYTYCLDVCGVPRLYFVPSTRAPRHDAPRAVEVSKFDLTYRDQMFKCWALKTKRK